MEKYNFSRVISNRAHIPELGSKTLEYRVNGLINSCNIHPNEESVEMFDDRFAGRLVFDFDDKRFITTAFKLRDENYGDYVHLEGRINELSFAINNYYGDKNIDRKVVEIPFSINLVKVYNGSKYEIRIESDANKKTGVTLTKDEKEEIYFSGKNESFNDVLCAIKYFVIDPQFEYDMYELIVCDKMRDFIKEEKWPVKTLKRYK